MKIHQCLTFSLLLLAWSGMSPVLSAERQTLPPVAKPFPAADFTLEGEDEKHYRLSQFRGKVVVLNFWATWCPPCREEMPSMERAWNKLKNRGVVFLGVNVGENRDTIFEFFSRYPVSFPLPMDQDGKVIRQYPVTGLPTTYIVNPAGMVTHRAVGSREWDSPDMIRKLLSLRIRK